MGKTSRVMNCEEILRCTEQQQKNASWMGISQKILEALLLESLTNVT